MICCHITNVKRDFYLYVFSCTFQRTYNDKAYTSPHLFGQFFNFRIFIKFFIHEVKKTSKFEGSGCICITNINDRDFYVHQGIYLKEYIGISTFSYTILFPLVLHNFLQKISVHYGNKLCTRRKLCNTGGGGTMLHGQKTACHKTGIRQGYLVIVGSFE